MTAGEIAEQLAQLREAGRRLRRRPIKEVLDVLGAVLDGWRDSSSSWRRDLEEQLPSATGFTRPMVEEVLLAAEACYQAEQSMKEELRAGKTMEEVFKKYGRW